MGIKNDNIKGFDLFTIFCLLNQICLVAPTNTFCTSNMLMNLFPEAISSGLLKTDKSSIQNFDDFLTTNNSFNCRANKSDLLNKLDTVDDILDENNPLFDVFRNYTSNTKMGKVYTLQNIF